MTISATGVMFEVSVSLDTRFRTLDLMVDAMVSGLGSAVRKFEAGEMEGGRCRKASGLKYKTHLLVRSNDQLKRVWCRRGTYGIRQDGWSFGGGELNHRANGCLVRVMDSAGVGESQTRC